MPNQNDSAAPSGDSSQHPRLQPELLSPTARERQVGAQTKQRAEDQQATAKEMRREFRWFEWSSVIINLALAIIGVCALRVYNGQLKVMSDQLTEMGKSREQAKADDTAAITAQEKIATDTLVTAQKNFERSSRDSEMTFRNEQRAWVGPTGRAPAQYTDDSGKPVYLKFAQKPGFSIVITNSGKTPALKVRSIIAVWTFPAHERFVPHYGESQTVSTVQTLFPGAISILSTRSDLPEISGLLESKLRSGEGIYHVYGRIDYEDVFHKPHETTFCVYVSQDFAALYNCPSYNDAK